MKKFYNSDYDNDVFDENPNRRTKFTHPYSYDEFSIFDYTRGKDISNIQVVYSDRLRQWDYDKYDRASAAMDARFTSFANLSATQLTKFLQSYYDDNTLECVKLVEGCNKSSGYPYWIIFFIKNGTTD